MKICIYNEPRDGAMGGSEVAAAILAEGLAQEHEVEIVHNRPEWKLEKLAQFAAADLSGVSFKLSPDLQSWSGPPWKVFGRLKAEQRQEAKLSEGCDVFIAFVHEPPPFCAAANGILWVLFPFHPLDPPTALRRFWHRSKVRSRLRGYRVQLAISEFSRHWSRERWGAKCAVLYPPVEVDGLNGQEKANVILSVGRLAVDGHGKKQREMLQSFAKLKDTNSDWSYVCAGACGDSAGEQAFLAEVRRMAARSGAEILPNQSRARLKAAYGRAKIFWHAAGFGSDEKKEPEQAEHFGISTVEAMAAGAVPVVINKGGQSEIVEHGESGFLWNTLEELQSYTISLMKDDNLRQRMSTAARLRAQKFSRGKFVEEFRRIVEGFGRARNVRYGTGSTMEAQAMAQGS